MSVSHVQFASVATRFSGQPKQDRGQQQAAEAKRFLTTPVKTAGSPAMTPLALLSLIPPGKLAFTSPSTMKRYCEEGGISKGDLLTQTSEAFEPALHSLREMELVDSTNRLCAPDYPSTMYIRTPLGQFILETMA
jgi:hypothetical protein